MGYICRTFSSKSMGDGEDDFFPNQRKKHVSHFYNRWSSTASYLSLVCILGMVILSSSFLDGAQARPASFYAVLSSSPSYSHNFAVSSPNLNHAFSNHNINNNNINNKYNNNT